MASSVAQPLERQLAQIPGIAQMTSTSSLGSTAVTIQFDLNRSIDGAANDIQAAINAASGQLPKNLPSPPTYRKVNPADSPILLLSATSDTLPLIRVSDAVDAQLAQQISQISGVAQVFIGGQQKPAIRVQVDPAKLVAKGLSLEDVRSQIAITTVDSPKGNIDGATRAYTIYANDQLLDAKDWNDVIIAYRNGGPLRIRDIGQAVAGPEDMKQAAWADGKRGVFLVIFKQPGANVIETVDRIKAQLPRLIAAIPPAIKIKIISDRTLTIRAAVEDVQITLLITIVLVVMVIFIFLRSFWATVIPAVTVPLALLGACALMWAFGYTLDNLSLMALTIAVGFVVDDAIVMLENITRYVEEGEKPLAAAFKGASEIGFTIVSISVSLVAVLIPLLLMGGIIGRLFREFAVTLAMAIFVSLVVSLTLTPMMASRFLRAHNETRHGRFYQWSERAFERMLDAYERGLDRALRWKLTTLCIFFATLALSVYLFIIIPKGFFPQQDNGFLTGTSEAAQDISFADMKRHQEELSQIVQADPAVDSIAMFIGGGGTALNSGRMYVTLEAARPARCQCAADHRAAEAEARKGRGRPTLHAGLPGRAPRRPRHAHAVRIHAAGCQSRRAERVGAEDPGRDAEAAAIARRRHRPADPGHHADDDDRPRYRVALRHPAAIDRRHAVRRVRPAPGHPVFHPTQQLSRDPGNPAGNAGQARHARQALHQVAADRRRGAAVGVLQMDDDTGAPAVDRPSGPVSGDHHQLQPRRERRPRPGHRCDPEGGVRSRRARHARLELSRAPRRRSSNRSAPCRS